MNSADDKTDSESHRLLIDGFLESARRFPDRPALEVDDCVHTYRELADQAARIANSIQQAGNDSTLVGVLAHNSLTAYSGMLGSLISGCGYVALHPQHPVQRIVRSIELAKLRVVIAGVEALECLQKLLPNLVVPITVIFPQATRNGNGIGNGIGDGIGDLIPLAGPHRIIGADDISGFNGEPGRPASQSHDLAYVVFTSGSTGIPKGVPVRNRNVVPFVEYMKDRCNSNHHDRFSQISDLTFDLSIFPVWTCWESGACLCCVDEKSRLAPAKFIRDKRISVWTSVPSTAVLLKRMRLLKPASFPSIRYSFFCGEPLPSESAKAWQTACPNSIVENMYGPSEATCAITCFTWTGDDSNCTNGIVPIGWPYETQRAAVVDEHFNVVQDGREGELCLAGSQVVDGYLDDPERTREKFIRIPALGDETWYRTGDLAMKDHDGCYFFRGRIDFQVKVLGHRIELQEVEQAICRATNSETAVCLPWPIVDGAPQSLVGFAECADGDCSELSVLRQCALSLPEYMVPKRVHFLPSFPLNPNGKIDRAALARMLGEGVPE